MGSRSQGSHQKHRVGLNTIQPNLESCGNIKKDLTLSDREYVCDACGVVEDRDLNAASNLANLAVSSTVTACGEASAGSVSNDRAKLASVKQELNSELGLPHFA